MRKRSSPTSWTELGRETVSKECERGSWVDEPLTNAPALVEKTKLELGKEEVDGFRAVVGDDHPSCAHRRLAHVVRVVRQTAEDRLDDATQVRREAVAERRGKEDEERDVSLANVGTGTARVGDDGREEAFEAVDSKPGEDLRDSLRGSLLVDSARRRLEDAHERVDEVGEVVLSETLDETSEGLGGGRTSFRNGIDEDAAKERDELREVGDEVLGLGEGRHVADDGGGLALDIGTAFAETTIQDGNDLDQNR